MNTIESDIAQKQLMFEAVERGLRLFNEKLNQNSVSIGEIGTYYYFMMALYRDIMAETGMDPVS